MQKWLGLLTRPNIMKNLKSDRDSVLDGIINDAIRIKEEFESRSGKKTSF